jgi:hypothetical protein
MSDLEARIKNDIVITGLGVEPNLEIDQGRIIDNVIHVYGTYYDFDLYGEYKTYNVSFDLRIENFKAELDEQ